MMQLLLMGVYSACLLWMELQSTNGRRVILKVDGIALYIDWSLQNYAFVKVDRTVHTK